MTDKKILNICNNALDLVGQGRNIKSFDETESRESQLCNRLFQDTVDRLLDQNDFLFARKDEIINADYLVYVDEEKTQRALSLPWQYTYSIPTDCMRILRLAPMHYTSDTETIGFDDFIRFDIRNFNNKRVFVTDEAPSFAMHYQAYVTDPSLFTPSFIEVLEYALASRLASSLIKDVNGVKISQALLQQAEFFLVKAKYADLQQGAYAIRDTHLPRILKARE